MTTRQLAARLAALLMAMGLVLGLTATPQAAADMDGLRDHFEALGERWYPVAGDWAAVDGSATSTSGAGEHGHALALRGLRAGGDLSVSLTLTLPGDGAATSWGGVQVHRQALTDTYARSGYTAFVRRNGELVIIAARDGVAVDTLAKAQTPARPATGPVELTLSISGDELVASAAGVTVRATDTRYRSGGISLAAHRSTSVAVDSLAVDGTLTEFDEPIPVPTDCVVPSDDPVGAARGAVLNSAARIAAVSDRVQRGVEPQASAFARLEADLERDLARTPAAPEVWFVPFFYNNPDAHRAARDGLQDDANAAYRLALAYRITGDANYGAKAATFLDDWSQVPCLRTSEDSALAFSYHFPAMVFAAELLRGTPVWADASEARFARMLRWQAGEVAASITHLDNNWGSWGAAASTAIAAYLDDAASLEAATTRVKALLDEQISAEGHLVHEVGRNNGVGDYGIWYSHFSLFPTLLAAEIVDSRGTDLFSYVNANGVTMGDAVAVLAGWVDAPETFQYYTGTDLTKLANVRTIDYLRNQGVIAHSMSYFELAANHYDLPLVESLIAEEGPMTTIHSAPHLSLTHGDLADLDPEPTPTPSPTPTASPTPSPTPTVTPSVTPTVTPSPSPSPAPSTPPVDVYSTPGLHLLNGRRWLTVCEPYSQTTRCTTLIWATRVQHAGGRYVQTNGWQFNNLTYLPMMKRSQWAGNPLGSTGAWTAADGRRWRTECDTQVTGRGGCRNYVVASVIEARDGAYVPATRWVFNSIVRFA